MKSCFGPFSKSSILTPHVSPLPLLDLVMEGQKAGKLEVDANQWRELLELALEEGQFSEYQNRNLKAWLANDWKTLVNSKVCTMA